jgi:hypothetical protein
MVLNDHLSITNHAGIKHRGVFVYFSKCSIFFKRPASRVKKFILNEAGYYFASLVVYENHFIKVIVRAVSH